MVTTVVVLSLAAALAALAVRQTLVFPLQPHKAPLSDVDDELRASALRLETHIRAVASVPHNLRHPAALEAAAVYIESRLVAFGFDLRPQVFDVGGRSVRNIEIILEPKAHAANRGTIVLGAHYDSDGDSPGANDNGTGVAALLEIARRLAAEPLQPTRCLRLVFYVNEEQPYGKTDAMGSLRHARRLAETDERIDGMIALETLGYFTDKPGSQRLPFPFNLLYADTGNFVAFIGLPGARLFLTKALGHFRATDVFPSTGTIVPAFVEGADLSDHWAYHELGYAALMVTDTAPYRNPFYHQKYDLPDTVDYLSLARITAGIEGMIRRLVED